MHGGTIYFPSWFRHKCRMKSMAFGYGPYSHLKGHNCVCHLTCFPVMKGDLMLCRCCLMMRGFHLKSHILKSQYHITSCIFTQIHRTYIQVSGFFVRNRCRHSVVINMKQEKLAFRVNIAGVSCLFCCLRCFFQNVSGAHLMLRSVCTAHITDQSCNLSLLRTPWEN